ncbi:MAG TPA: ATP-binding protein [Candidatus Omnitrophota bacterium]|nr:ATP-binding protein [Candidatus Omnitrophota bacterium]
MQGKLRDIKYYILIKWVIIAIIAVFVGFEIPFGFLDFMSALPNYIALFVAAMLNLWFQSLVRRAKPVEAALNIVISFDLAIILLAIYFNGGLDNTWLYLPVIVIFFIGYLFNLKTSLTYAGGAFLGVLGMFLLEYFRMIPHFNTYHLAGGYDQRLGFIIDHLIGIFILYFVGALSSGYLNRAMLDTSEKLDKSIIESEAAREEAEKTRRAFINIMDDVERARQELEKKVKERTSELESIRASLEQKVAERTRDVEESRKAILHMLKDLKEDVTKLKELDRMKNEFISVVSHELRTPLTPLMDYASILLEGIAGPTTDKQKEIYESLIRLSKRELNLINSLLDISRLEFGTFAPVKKELQIANIVNDSINDVAKDAQKKQITISKEIVGDPPAVIADESLISRLIAQLINNAMKFTPAGGQIRLRYLTEGDNVRFEIKDTGVGLIRDNLEKIFEKFFQADTSYARQFGGMGLGLAICRQIVLSHNGRIWAESEGLGKGTTFVFTLPVKG